MGSATQWRGAYSGEYLRAGLRLRARGGRRVGKISNQTRTKKELPERWLAPWRLIRNLSPRPNPIMPFIDVLIVQGKSNLHIKMPLPSMRCHVGRRLSVEQNRAIAWRDLR
jgi:hypothetical protein